MNPFNVGDEVRVKGGRRIGLPEGVITSISPCRYFLRFYNHKFGYDFTRYELVTPLSILSYEDML